MSYLGSYTTLKVAQVSAPGAFLQAGDEQILLPKSIAADVKAGDEVNVFIYRDAEGRLIAINERPKLLVGECGFLKAKENTGFGTFMDWEISKDLLVPFSEQKTDMVEGRSYLVYVFIDEKTNKIIGTTYIDDFINNSIVELEENEQVDLLIIDRTELGFKAVVNNRHLGLLYHNEIFRTLEIGEQLKGYVKSVREDRKIDLSLQQQGYDEVGNAVELVLEKMKKSNGVLKLHDKSDPEEIYSQLGISKKLFKKAIGKLYKEKKITIGADSISLTSAGPQ